MDAARVSDPPIHFPLRTENASGKTAALHHSRRASRLSKRCEEARYAAQCQCSARIFVLRDVSCNFWALCVGGVRGFGVRLRLLRHAPLCNAPFSHETRRVALVEAVSSPPSLQRRSRGIRHQLAALGLRLSDHAQIELSIWLAQVCSPDILLVLKSESP